MEYKSHKINWHRIAFIGLLTYVLFNQGQCETADAAGITAGIVATQQRQIITTIDELPISLELTQMDTFDFHGTEFYQLKRGNLVLVVSTDPGNDAAKWLKKHVGEKIVVTLTGKD